MPRLNPFDKIKEEYGRGVEKIIYESKDNPNELIAVLKFSKSENALRIKARYYLSKILHFLFPKNIPDIHLASFKDNKPILIIEKKNLDLQHNYLRRNYDYKDLQSRIQNREIYSHFVRKIVSDPNYNRLSRELLLLGIFLDSNPLNFGYDEENNLVYVDNNFIPWYTDNNGKIIRLGYDPEKLKESIMKLSSPTREMVLSYFRRLEELKIEYEKNIN